jgi:hypothetical protein
MLERFPTNIQMPVGLKDGANGTAKPEGLLVIKFPRDLEGKKDEKLGEGLFGQRREMC